MGTPFVGSVVVTIKTLRARPWLVLPARTALWIAGDTNYPLWIDAARVGLWIKRSRPPDGIGHSPVSEREQLSIEVNH
ncbi:hypothetical protein HMPREF1980_01842 [Actinomyces sp. oral taxon 172 str. F0311]|jgi:hypothetical protein|nr:hypothetical protein HMPREF1980_01842 [Actinomyces sp. oral taxon 172 str. F0311]